MKDEVHIIHNLEVIKPFQEQLERTQTSFKIPVQISLKTLDLNHLKKKTGLESIRTTPAMNLGSNKHVCKSNFEIKHHIYL